MVISDARREANRRNALRSTGPKTAEGKAAACRNSWRHGFTATVGGVVGAEEAARIEQRTAAFRAEFGPRSEWGEWLVGELAGVSVRLDRIAASEVEWRGVAAHRADTLWDEDRRLAAEEAGARLPADPARAVAILRQSPHGCDWLIERWAVLARLADEAGDRGWTEEESRLAHDLMGRPAEARGGPVGLVIDEAGRTDGSAILPPAALARQRIAELQAHRDRVAEPDEVARALVVAGLTDLPSRELAHLRRYERATLRRLAWLQTRLTEAGLLPPAHPSPTGAARPAEVRPPDIPAEPPIPASTTISPLPDVMEEVKRHVVDAVVARIERNEAIWASSAGETKPPGSRNPAQPAPKFATDPDRQRPDLAKLARRAKEKRRALRSA